MDQIIDNNIVHFDNAGKALGTAIGKSVRYVVSKVLSYSLLLIFGIGVFLFSAISGAVKSNNQTRTKYGYLKDSSDDNF